MKYDYTKTVIDDELIRIFKLMDLNEYQIEKIKTIILAAEEKAYVIGQSDGLSRLMK